MRLVGLLLVLLAAAVGCAPPPEEVSADRAVGAVDNNGTATYNIYANDAFLGRSGARSERAFRLPPDLVGSGVFVEFTGRRVDRQGNESDDGISWSGARPIEPGTTTRLNVPYARL